MHAQTHSKVPYGSFVESGKEWHCKRLFWVYIGVVDEAYYYFCNNRSFTNLRNLGSSPGS